jgi:hypothetical protein
MASAEGLPFRDLLSAEQVGTAWEKSGVEFRDRIYNPTVTLWAFLSQVVASKDASCKDAVARVAADRVAHGKKACSPDTNSYCRARCRLPFSVVVELARSAGRELHRQAPPNWLWKGRRVSIVDGSTTTMPDTPENQAEYPQSRNQKAGLGFPILRFVVLLSLSVGTVLECAMGRCRGKMTGEQSLFREMWDALQPGDLVLGDRLYDSYRDIAALKQRGIDSVFGRNPSRNSDFRTGQRLGLGDHIVTWNRPPYDPSRFASREEWESLPEELRIRETRVTVRRPGFRTRRVVIVTTLLDADEYAAHELTDLFAARWNCELDLRSIKQALGLAHLSCRTPEMVRKELWMYLLAYNLIRVRMAQAAMVADVSPRSLSFSDAKKLVDSFAPHLRMACGAEFNRMETELIHAIARCRLHPRPGRKEPRAVKRREQKYKLLTTSRATARKGLAA